MERKLLKEQKEEKAVASVSTVEDRYEEPRKESKVETVAEPKAPETKPEAQSGVMTKYEDVGIILVTKCQYMPIIGGYASTTRYALIDLVEGKMAIIDYTKIIDGVWNSLTEEEKLEEGSKDQYDTREYTLSNEERETIYNMVKNAQNNINSNDVYSFEFYRDNMFDIQAAGMWEYEDDGTDNDYFKIDSSKYEETVYVFDNAAQIKFLHNLLEK